MIEWIQNTWNELSTQGKLYAVFNCIYVFMGLLFIGLMDEVVEHLKQISKELKEQSEMFNCNNIDVEEKKLDTDVH